MSRVKEYQAEGVVIRFNGARCIHAARCVDGLRAVFDPGKRPWIDPTQAHADAIAEVVCRCPSGALTYERTDGGAQEVASPSVSIRARPDGPLFVTGHFTVTEGETTGPVQTRAALCRCGASANKPYCDNSHKKVGFKG